MIMMDWEYISLSQYCNNLVEIDYLSILFPNCEKIIIWGTGNILSHCKEENKVCGVYECKFIIYWIN